VHAAAGAAEPERGRDLSASLWCWTEHANHGSAGVRLCGAHGEGCRKKGRVSNARAGSDSAIQNAAAGREAWWTELDCSSRDGLRFVEKRVGLKERRIGDRGT
jgi:hypothetical protein